MGFFSWITSDTERSISNRYSSRDTFPVYLLLPHGGTIEETDYDGYGRFGGRDVYELVAEWNKDFIDESHFEKPIEGNGDNAWYGFAMERYERRIERAKDFKTHDDEYMRGKYGDGYLRDIGIDIACYDWQNEALKYPIKLVENPNADYSETKPSKDCPSQGYFY